MEKERALLRLKELGINTQNFFDKRTYLREGAVHVGIFPVEAGREDHFYFTVNNENEIYSISRDEIQKCPKEEHLGKEKYQVLLSKADCIYRESAEEFMDENVKNMTIRDYCAIHWQKPVSSKDWLNALIIQNKH
jgi:hypothetical protein